MTVEKQTIGGDIFSLFYNLLYNNIKSITRSDSTVSTIKYYVSSFPDLSLDEKSDYPVMIINTPELKWNHFTFGKKNVDGNIEIDIICTKKEDATKFCDAINNLIETKRKDLTDEGLTFVNLEETRYDTFFRGNIKLHAKTSVFSFKYKFTQTKVY